MVHRTLEEDKHEKKYCDIDSCASQKGIKQIKYLCTEVGFIIIKIQHLLLEI